MGELNLFAYCGNDPVNRNDPTGHSWKDLWSTFTQLLQQASGYFAVSLGISQLDSPLPGGADLISLGLLGLGALACFGVALYSTIVAPAFPAVPAKNDAENKSIAVPRYSDNQAIFTEDPYQFNPIGLIRKDYVEPNHGINGGIIKWEIPGTHTAIFEWNQDYINGSHYHVMQPSWNNQHDGRHYFPGELVPEPWNTIYFWG